MAQEPAGSAPRSIYLYILENTKDGRLPEGFSIPWQESMWAPGAQDGVALYHMFPIESTPDPERDRKILKALKLMAAEDNGQHVDEIMGIFEELDGKDSMVRLFEPIVRSIAEHRKELDLSTLLQYGDFLISSGTTLTEVKLGLSIIAAFTIPFVEEVVLELGLYDEFTYYAARVLTNGCWPDGNEKLFTLAKTVTGWGRIHAVDWILPETREIRDWLLFKGADNQVIPQYSSDVCLQKAEAEARLDGSLTAEEYEAIGKLIRESLEEGPCPGVTDGERILPKYIARAKEFPVDAEAVRMILEAADEYGLEQDVRDTAKQLIGE